MRISPINSSLQHYSKPTFKSQEPTDSFSWEEVPADLMAGGFLLSTHRLRDYVNEAKTTFDKVSRTILCIGAISYAVMIISKDIRKLFD